MALEELADFRHEYYHSEIFPLDGADSPKGMAGGIESHNRLIQHCAFALRTGLRGGPCEVFAENVKLALAHGKHFNYSDAVVSGDPDDNDLRTVHRPALVMKVLSESTEARDRGWKFEQYQKLPSLQQYVLISQYKVLTDSFVRTSHRIWELTPLWQPDDVLQLPTLELSIPLAAIYEHISLIPIWLAYE